MEVCRGPEHDFKPFLYEWKYQICEIQCILEMGENGIWRVTQSQCLPFNFTNVMACTQNIYRNTESGLCAHSQTEFGGTFALGGTDNQSGSSSDRLSSDGWIVLGYVENRQREVSTWSWHTSSGHSTESRRFIWQRHWSFRAWECKIQGKAAGKNSLLFLTLGFTSNLRFPWPSLSLGVGRSASPCPFSSSNKDPSHIIWHYLNYLYFWRPYLQIML